MTPLPASEPVRVLVVFDSWEGHTAAVAHGQTVARVAARLRGVTMAAGNRWPTPEVVARRRALEQRDPAMGRPQ